MPPPRRCRLQRQLVAASAFVFFLLSLSPASAQGNVYTVGDGSFSWDSGINYASWSQKYSFVVGDVLVFQYVSTQHNVYEVTERAYRTCDDGGSGVLNMYNTGHDRVVLAEAKTYWFVCTFPGHCLGGMKVAVNVTVAAGGGGGGGGGANPGPNVPPVLFGNNAASTSAGCRSWMAWGLALAAVVVINWAG